MITVQTGNPLTVGRQYKISIKFTSILNAILRGFYRSSYVEDGITKSLPEIKNPFIPLASNLIFNWNFLCFIAKVPGCHAI